MDTTNRYRGALLGLATGDALGTMLEFQAPGSFEPISDIVGGGPFNLKPGQWTDDTSMALCLAESLIECQGFDPVDQLKRYVRWWREGHLSSTGTCFDIGMTTSKALRRFEKTGEAYCGSSCSSAAGNGCIMRLAPVPLFYENKAQEAIQRSADSSRTTHGAEEAVDACRYLGALIVGAVNGVEKKALLSAHYSPVAGYWEKHPLTMEIAEIANGAFKQREPPEIEGSGYCVRSLEAALWAFHKTDNFRDGCLLAVNLGDDADTTGAVYGQIAGAFYGEQQIPAEWLSKLAMRKVIEKMADDLCAAAQST
jgi:ADP-ribosylglycohydrolase